MKGEAIPDQCKSCRQLWTGGTKDGKHDRWCCLYSAPAPKTAAHCRNMGTQP